MNRIAVVTTITGGYNTLVSHPEDPSVDWIVLTDAPVADSGGWDVRVYDTPNEHPRLTVKRFRTMHHELLPEYDYTIGLDGNVQVKPGVNIAEVVDFVDDSGLAMFEHCERNCVSTEAEASMAMWKYRGSRCREQAAAYLSSGHPRNWGLWWCGFIVRRNNSIPAEVMGMWCKEINEWSDPGIVINDQIAFPYVCHEVGVRPASLPLGDYTNAHLENPWTFLESYNRDE